MATREEILLGYQLIEKMNVGNAVTWGSSCFFRELHPDSLEELRIVEIPQGGEENKPVERRVRVDDVKTFTEGNCKGVDIEVEKRLAKFLAGFWDRKAVANGLGYFKVTRGDLEGDKDEVLQHTPNVRNVIGLVPDLQGMRPSGDLLSLYRERIELEVSPEIHIQKEHNGINALQNLINAMAFELRGICNYTGEEKYHTVEDRLKIVASRMSPAFSLLNRCPLNKEVRGLSRVLKYVSSACGDAKTVDDLTAIGKYIDGKVEQLPILWRWWNYGR